MKIGGSRWVLTAEALKPNDTIYTQQLLLGFGLDFWAGFKFAKDLTVEIVSLMANDFSLGQKGKIKENY